MQEKGKDKRTAALCPLTSSTYRSFQHYLYEEPWASITVFLKLARRYAPSMPNHKFKWHSDLKQLYLPEIYEKLGEENLLLLVNNRRDEHKRNKSSEKGRPMVGGFT